MDKITADLLLYAKAFCLRAEEEFSRRSPVGCMEAVLHMQDAAEFCLNAILNEYSIARQLHDNFGDIRKRVNYHFKNDPNPKLLPLPTQMDFLNASRGKVKHHASVPSEQDTERCLTYGRSFLEQVFRDYFGVNFSSFSLSALVQSEDIRRWLQEAEQQIDSGDFLEALICIAKAFRLAKPQQGLMNDAEYSQMLMEAGTDTMRLRRVRGNLPLLHPILDQEDNHGGQRLTPRRYSILAHNNLDTSAEAVEKTLHAAVELILVWQEVGMVGYKVTKSYEPGSLQPLRIEEIP